MQFAGVIPEDAPDPQLERDPRVRSLPFAIVGLEPAADAKRCRMFGAGVRISAGERGSAGAELDGACGQARDVDPHSPTREPARDRSPWSRFR